MFDNNVGRKMRLFLFGSLKYPSHLPKLMILLLLLALFADISANDSPQNSVPGQEEISPDIQSAEDLVQSLIDAGKRYLGNSYKFKNPLGDKMDCSGYLSYLFSLHDISLPNSSGAIGKSVDKINLASVQKGDLLFFKGRNRSSSAVGHVSMVIETNGSDLKMIHSCQRGVLIDDYPRMKYYRDRFLYAGRVPDLQKMLASMDSSEFQRQKPAMPQDQSALSKDATSLIPTRNSVSIIGVGDIMLGTNYPSDQFLPPNDGRDLLQPVYAILKAADLAFANLEGVFLTAPGETKKGADPGNSYAFKSPDHYVYHLRDAGIDVVSIANNHIGDFGETGKENTVKMLRDAGIEYAGLLEYPMAVFTKDAVRYGFCAFAPNNDTMKLNDYKTVRRVIEELDAVSDIVIVSFHGGGEGQKYRNITKKKELYLEEDRGNPYEFARVAIDAGADIVFGHGPHVPRAIDLYKNRFIAYSLGNFATYARFNLKGSNGIAPIVRVNVSLSGEFIDAQIISAKQSGEGGPVIDADNAAVKEISRLTKMDFPKSKLVISDSGYVALKQIKVNR
ncbi:MAG: CapA family protein [Candidatus Cloacimonadaceae bacterium]|nr:CapA family protein [Candidatus Cloacimonadaceae bacterium]